MHRSRLSTLLIDCADEDFEGAARFWSAALGREVLPRDRRYVSLRGRNGGCGGMIVGLQRMDGRERGIHLDIETDDVDAEVARLRELGATVKARIRQHVVMEAPSGHAFCVVPVQRSDFECGAREWP